MTKSIEQVQGDIISNVDLLQDYCDGAIHQPRQFKRAFALVENIKASFLELAALSSVNVIDLPLTPRYNTAKASKTNAATNELHFYSRNRRRIG